MNQDKNLPMVLPVVKIGEAESSTSPHLQEEMSNGFRTVKAELTGDEFEVNENGVYWNESPKKKKAICGPLRIVALARDLDNREWTKVVRFADMDGYLHTHLIKMQDIDGEGLLGTLRSKGLTVSPERKAKEKLMVYLQDCPPENDQRFRVTSKTGWHDGSFVFPDGTTIGNAKESYLYHQPGMGDQPFCVSGSLEEWKEHVSSRCVGNSRLVFAVSLAFAAPLIEILKTESGGFNLVGSSSTGKSTALYVASSVCGNPARHIQNWRTTTNGLESTAKKHNDTLLLLDELGQVDAKDAGSAAYMLANGQGKKRSTQTGDGRPVATWRIILLSSGEISLADHMSEAGKKVRAGQELRLADIPADAGKNLGLFEDLHDAAGGAEFSEELKLLVTKYHGSALPAFINSLMETDFSIKDIFDKVREQFGTDFVPQDASSQVRRLAHRFSLIAAAGEIASLYGITGWKNREAYNAAGVCFESWLSERGGSGMQEVKTLLAQVRLFFEQHGESRFTPIDEKNDAEELYCKTINRAGFRKNIETGIAFYVLPEVFREICTGHNTTWAAKTLVEKGFLKTGGDGKPQVQRRLPGYPNGKRVYAFFPEIFNE